jgi:hypothetical protein
VTPAQRGTGAAKHPPADPGGNLRIIASIEQPEVIAKILSHLEHTAPQPHSPQLPLGARGPPLQSRLL